MPDCLQSPPGELQKSIANFAPNFISGLGLLVKSSKSFCTEGILHNKQNPFSKSFLNSLLGIFGTISLT